MPDLAAPDLIEKTPCDGLLPISVADTVLGELPFARITSIAPFAGQDRAVAAALNALGLGWPAPGRGVSAGAASSLWSGRRQALLVNSAPAGLDGIAALTDQSDAWARMCLSGPAAEAALARLVPLDLRLAVFPVGSVARTALNHMMTMLHRSGEVVFEIMVVRSMAGTAVHELHHALSALAARKTLATRPGFSGAIKPGR